MGRTQKTLTGAKCECRQVQWTYCCHLLWRYVPRSQGRVLLHCCLDCVTGSSSAQHTSTADLISSGFALLQH